MAGLEPNISLATPRPRSSLSMTCPCPPARLDLKRREDLAGIEIDLPVGDPGGMRTTAARIGIECSGLLAAADAINRAGAAMVYRCVAGNRFREKVVRQRGELVLLVGELQAVQKEIVCEASGLEAAQLACGRLVRQIEANPAGVAAEVTAALQRELRSLLEDL